MKRLAVVLVSVLSVFAVGACAPAARQGWKNDMLAQINAERAAVGAAPLHYCGTLDVAADGHSADQANHDKMTHTGSDGSGLGTRSAGAGYSGYSTLGENVASGQSSVGSVMSAWMTSSGHRGNILNGGYGDVGMGLAYSAGGTPYWTQVFGSGGTC